MNPSSDDPQDRREPDGLDPDEAAWREIVEHYGERPALPDLEPDLEVSEPDRPEPEPAEPGPELEADVLEAEDRFVPPPPPPLPRPRGIRLAAWLGVFLAPALLLVALVATYRLPDLVATLLIGWFVLGFGWLVWHMPRQRDDPWDDGARL